MQKGKVLYYKKKAQGWVVKTAKGKVLLPEQTQQIWDDGSLREIRTAEKRPRPKEMDSVVFGYHLGNNILWALVPS